MTGPQTEIEIRLWGDEFARMRQTRTIATAMAAADALVADYRARYGQPQPAADDRLGRAAIEAMDAIMGAMREEHEDAKLLTLVEQAVQKYMGERWHIQKENGK